MKFSKRFIPILLYLGVLVTWGLLSHLSGTEKKIPTPNKTLEAKATQSEPLSKTQSNINTDKLKNSLKNAGLKPHDARYWEKIY